MKSFLVFVAFLIVLSGQGRIMRETNTQLAALHVQLAAQLSQLDRIERKLDQLERKLDQLK